MENRPLSGLGVVDELLCSRLADAEHLGEAGQRETFVGAEAYDAGRAQFGNRRGLGGEELTQLPCGFEGLALRKGLDFVESPTNSCLYGISRGVERIRHGHSVSEFRIDPSRHRIDPSIRWVCIDPPMRKGRTMRVELVAPAVDEMVLQVDAGAMYMRVAQAVFEASGWRVQTVLTGHEEIAPTTVAAIGALIAAAHAVFPGRQLEIVDEVIPACESCGRARGDVRLEFPGYVLLVCLSCEVAYRDRGMAVAS